MLYEDVYTGEEEKYTGLNVLKDNRICDVNTWYAKIQQKNAKLEFDMGETKIVTTVRVKNAVQYSAKDVYW